MPVQQETLSALLAAGKHPTLDSPTYLWLSGEIDGEEWVRRVQASRERLGLPRIENLAAPTHSTPEQAARIGAWLRKGKRPTFDSPTYLRITGQIDEAEYQRRLDAGRARLGLPPIRH